MPSLCALWLAHPKEPKQGSFSQRFEAGFDWTIRQYDRGLGWVLDHAVLTLLVALATFVLTAVLYLAIPKGLFPGAGHRPAAGRHGGFPVPRPTPP